MRLFSSKPPTAGCEFKMETAGEDVVIRLQSPKDLVPTAEWLLRRPDCAGAFGELFSAAEDERSGPDGRPMVVVDQASIRIHPAQVAALDASDAIALSLPAATPFALDIRPRHRIDEDRFIVETRWVRPGGQPALAQLTGAILQAENGARRVPEPLWSLHRAAKALAAPLERNERFKALAELQRHWPTDALTAVETDGYLQELRIHYASTLSLKLKTLTPDRTEFDPLLFGAVSTHADSESAQLDEDVDSLLPPASQRLFAEQRFRREAEARSVYVLRDGEYVVIDPALRPALDVVRKMQDRPEAERRAFVLNPRRVLRETIGDERANEIGLDDLFIETEQFSSRVAGVDVWRKPVLPWLTPIGRNQWLPEKFGLRIGDDYFVVPPENVAPALDRVQAAVNAKRSSVRVEDLVQPVDASNHSGPVELPATPQTVEALRGLSDLIPIIERGDADGVAEDQAAWDARLGKLFLVVRENFEDVEFAAEGAADEAAEPFAAIGAPRRLHSTLKEHQVAGLNWLAESAARGRPGALLADDMGLGKTLQAIGFMAHLQEEAEAGRRQKAAFLIVAPTGLLGTWRDEIAKHLEMPRLGSLIPAFGSDLKTLKEQDTFGAKDIESGKAALRAEAWHDAGVVLTTYETLRDYHFSFARTRFGLIVYDEIQKLKNPASQMTRACKALNADFVLGMTGTPVENRLQDLWSIMDVVSPGLLGSSRDFERRHPHDDKRALAALKSTLMDRRATGPAYMLRRMKAEALDALPAKHTFVAKVDMPPVQAAAYKDLVLRAAGAASSGAMGKGGMLSTLAAMRGVSLHPIDPRQAPADLDAYAKDSARLGSTLRILDDIASRNERALIFVEDLAMQERLAGLIQSRFRLKAMPTRINGSVPGPKRQQMVSAFQSNRTTFDVMILSPKAGGVGLTLTTANHVIHLSRWWNPAVEDQATDRVFRIGQTRDVHVHLPLAVHPDPAIRESSFDLRLNALIDRKRTLTRDLFLPPDGNDEDLADLFREVSLNEEAIADPPANASVDEPTTASPSEPKISRPTLSLPKELVSSGAKVWRCRAGEPRPKDEILGLFRGKDVSQIVIRDPYALGSANSRSAQANFLSELFAATRSIGAVTIEYSPDVDGDADESFQRRQFGEFYGRAFHGQAPPRMMLTRRAKRSRDDDFHDRIVELQIRHAGGAIRRHELIFGRGLEALYDSRKECNVAYAPPTD